MLNLESHSFYTWAAWNEVWLSNFEKSNLPTIYLFLIPSVLRFIQRFRFSFVKFPYGSVSLYQLFLHFAEIQENFSIITFFV